MTLSVQAAIEAVCAVMSEHGHTVDPVVIADRSNLVLRIDLDERTGVSLVARVSMATSIARIGLAWLRREVEVARFLHERGVRVTRPSAVVDAGPLERNGIIMSFWELESLTGEMPDPKDAGKALAAAHRALIEYPSGDLPTWGALAEAREVFARVRSDGAFDSADLVCIEAAWARTERIADTARSRSASWQAVHGDAHLGNVLSTARGAVWTDWEDAFVGPVEWDLACMCSRAELFGEERVSIESLMSAYDGNYDPGLVRELAIARNVQAISWLALFAQRQPSLLARVRARISKIEGLLAR